MMNCIPRPDLNAVKQKILHKPSKLALPARDDTPGAQPSEGGGVASDTLLGPQGELKIRHNGELYSLRKTRFNKLILTK